MDTQCNIPLIFLLPLHAPDRPTSPTTVQVSVVSFKKGGLTVRCHAWDRNLGGRDVDELLYDHFCKEIQERFKLDVRSNAKASFKLRMQCQRLKKVGWWGGPAMQWWLYGTVGQAGNAVGCSTGEVGEERCIVVVVAVGKSSSSCLGFMLGHLVFSCHHLLPITLVVYVLLCVAAGAVCQL